MLLTATLISGGVLALGVKRYQEKKRQKETPWTVYAEKVGVLKRKKKKRLGFRALKEAQDSAHDYMQATIQTFNEKRPTLSGTRHQQMQEMVGDELSEAQREANRMFSIASANFALAGISLFYSPLLWLVVPVVVYSNLPFYRLAYKSIFEERRITSYVLDALLVTGMLLGQYFYTQVVFAWFSTLAMKLLRQTESDCKNNISNLFGTQPRFVWIQSQEGVEIQIPFEQLELGDTVMVSAGQMISVDGVIISGSASIDQHKLTGESQPVEKGVGEQVLASTVVLAGKIGIRTEKTGEETVAMQIGHILDQTTEFKDSLQSQGETTADRLAPFTLGLSVLCLPLFGYSSALAVFTNEFGYKMRLFAPASMLTFLNIASEQGILIKDGRSLELLNQIDTIVFDKTGTLTKEVPTIGKIHAYHGYGEDEILRYAAAAEEGQTHPIAKAILEESRKRKLTWPKMVDAKYEMGFGIQVELSDRVIRVGSDKFMTMNDIEIPSEAKDVQTYCHEHGHSLVLVAFDNEVVGVIELHATIRPEAREVINALRQRGMSMYIISGDHEAPTKKLAQTLGIENYFANTLPENKADLVSKLQDSGKSVCFVGDGINDSIALKKANVSVSLRGATTIATDTAQIIFMDGTLNALEKMFDVAGKYRANMKNNFLISTLPCVISIGGIIFFHWGVMIGMALNLGSMSLGVKNATQPLLNQQRDDTPMN